MASNGNPFSDEHLIKVASEITQRSKRNIVLFGGGCIIPYLSGHTMLRTRSSGLEFFMNEDGAKAINNNYVFSDKLKRHHKIRDIKGLVGSFYLDDVMVSLFKDNIFDYPITEEFFDSSIKKSTRYGVVTVIAPEINLALKIRRNIRRKSGGEFLGKDCRDYYTMLLGNPEIDEENWSKYMQNGVCSSCHLTKEAGCIDEMDRVVKSEVTNGNYAHFQELSANLRSYATTICPKRNPDNSTKKPK